jgi:S-adenosylmethionine/arginine decarboxylase-like enzyme
LPVVRSAGATVLGDFRDRDAVWLQFLQLANGVDGLTVLTSTRFDFPGGGMSGVVVVAESHLALHTWPERGCAWLGLTTCGTAQSLRAWQDRVQRAWPLAGAWAAIPQP